MSWFAMFAGMSAFGYYLIHSIKGTEIDLHRAIFCVLLAILFQLVEGKSNKVHIVVHLKEAQTDDKQSEPLYEINYTVSS